MFVSSFGKTLSTERILSNSGIVAYLLKYHIWHDSIKLIEHVMNVNMAIFAYLLLQHT